jgi:hypothetical protein
MQPSHQRSYMTQSPRRLFHDNRRDLGAVTVEAERNNSVSDNISMANYLWHGDSGASCHVANDTCLIAVVYILTSRLVMVNICIHVGSVNRRS